MEEQNTNHETKRDRVRRLLLDPLGFRFPKDVPDDQRRRRLDRLTDELAYMADDRLMVLREMMRTKGEGSARNHWPDHATFVGFAEIVQPRPLEELPALLRWFGSVEGPRALAEGTLVETWDWFRAHKAPPVTPQARAMVVVAAEAAARRLSIIAERRAAGLSLAVEDPEWEEWYLARRAACEALVERERSMRAQGEGAAA